VTRSRYAGWIPSVSASVRLFACPIIDPHRDAKGALTVIEETMRARGGSVVIFPEGHRSRDGEIQAFKLGGTLAALRARRTPIYLVVTDGVGVSQRLVDFALNIHRIRGRSEVMGPFAPPEAEAEWPAFVAGMRQRMVERLQEIRADNASL
jgi:1-acyl-sn-glycerol-3-phosphate acyltransferase